MRTTEVESNSVRDAVRDYYGKVASRERGCGCAPTCCGTQAEPSSRSTDEIAGALGYSARETTSVPAGANLGLGCGNPLAIAAPGPGQTVLDLGSGAGFDAFLAAKAVGPTGRVIGVDMTAEMVRRARLNKTKGGYENVEFRLGEIEHLPVADNSVDVIISNCVINLSPEKSRVFREAFRVLKQSGRLAISDILATKRLPDNVRKDLELHAGCVAGATSIDHVEKLLREAGFTQVRIDARPQCREFIREWFPNRGIEGYIVSATIEAVKE